MQLTQSKSDYGSEEEEEVLQHATNDYVNAELPDEGLGESDNRSYYTEDPAGLEVILEEPEEEYCSSHASEDDLQREVDITYELKGERRSLDGSEGIGSAEGDTQSSGGSEHYGELEDCASSGIHSEGVEVVGRGWVSALCDWDGWTTRPKMANRVIFSPNLKMAVVWFM
ncbi:hypothetical protein Pmani_030862 [Petrolisthes manimaculis]|uniref:Uncharacterized protein n=1 Tax=Petrolisthes manimaculis TaxID=1843537 RepID=A0AAE1TT24_9EUCA|nr:hypothetical protein Pmani_030862 [Petrolisthes manimaculis]